VFRGLRDGQAEVDPQHLGIQERQRSEGLVLRACGDVPSGGEVGQELFHFPSPQAGRVTPDRAVPVEADVLVDLAEVTLLGAVGVVLDAERLPDLVEELHGDLPFKKLCQGTVEDRASISRVPMQLGRYGRLARVLSGGRPGAPRKPALGRVLTAQWINVYECFLSLSRGKLNKPPYSPCRT